MDIDFEVEGADETAEMLEKAPKLVVARGFLKAAKAAVNVVEQALKPRIPKEHGDLEKALTHEITLDSQFRGVTADIGFGKEGHVANWNEYGHRMVGHKPKKKQVGEVQAKPFMRPAMASSAETAIDVFADTLRKELEGGLLEKAA